jgi:hypothetical protein
MLGGSQDLISQTSFVAGRPLFNKPNIDLHRPRRRAHRTTACVSTGIHSATPAFARRSLDARSPGDHKTILGGFARSERLAFSPPTYRPTVSRSGTRISARPSSCSRRRECGFTVELTGKGARRFRSSRRSSGVGEEDRRQGQHHDPAGSVYYGGSATTTPWLNALMPLTDWGHWAVPNVMELDAQQQGTWNGFTMLRSTTAI